MGGCQNYGPFLGILNIRCRTIIGIEKGSIFLTTNILTQNQYYSYYQTQVLNYWVHRPLGKHKFFLGSGDTPTYLLGVGYKRPEMISPSICLLFFLALETYLGNIYEDPVAVLFGLR